MSLTILGAAAIAKVVTPLIKDLYEGAKGGARHSLNKWNSTSFPKKLSKQLSQIDSVRTIWSPEENVSLRSFYYPCKFQTQVGRSQSVTSIDDLGDGNIVIQGIVGQGKSILMRYLAIQELLTADSPRLPIFLELRKITKSSSLLTAIKKVLTTYDIDVDDELFSYLAHSGRTVLLLDGFDELEPQLVKETTIEIEDLSNRYPELQIIISSRPNNEIQKVSSFQVLKIESLGELDHAPFLKALGLKAAKISDITHAIKSSPSKIAGLITTPLMLTLVVFVYQSEKQIPEDLPEFFEKLFYTVFTKHDKIKATFERKHFSGLSERKLQTLFEAFCFMCLQLRYRRTLNPSQFNEAFELAQDYVEGTKCEESAFKDDIVKVSCLMLEEGVGDVTFLHKSIAEYHAAAFVKVSDEAFTSRFYSEAASNWVEWFECLNFLSSIDPYRFAKYFAVENITRAIPILEKLESCSSGKEVSSCLPVWIKSPYIGYIKTEKNQKQYSRKSFGRWVEADNFYISELSEVLSKIAFSTPPDFITDSVLTELINSGV